jgi:hypothetical protein
MKALKERRVSLRSLFRRGLVILSILALAFAFAACGNGDDNGGGPGNGPGNGGGNGGGEPPPPPRQVVGMTLFNPDRIGREATLGNQQIGFQGLPPDLTGAVIELRWNDGARNTVTVDSTNADQFFTSPIAPDWPGVREDLEPFRIGHVTNTNASSWTSEFRYDRVVRLHRFNVSSQGSRTWYADRNPALIDNWVAEGTWVYERTAGTTGTWVSDETRADRQAVPGAFDAASPGATLGNTRVWRTTPIPLAESYPALDFGRLMAAGTGAQTEGIIVARIGSLQPQASWQPHPVTGGARIPANIMEVEIAVEFLQVSTVTVRQPGANFIIYNDQFVGMYSPTEANDINANFRLGQTVSWRTQRQNFLLNLVRDNDITFDVTYQNGTTRAITWAEFLVNRDYFFTQTGRDPNRFPLFVGMEGILEGASSGSAPMDYRDETRGLLDYDEDDPVWGFTLSYVGNVFSDTHIVWVSVELPVFEFEGFRENNPVEILGPSPAIYQLAARPQLASEIDGFLRALNNRYRVWGVYSREGAPNRERAIPIVDPMFPNINDAEILWPVVMQRGVLVQNHALAVSWLDGQETDAEEEGERILINIMGTIDTALGTITALPQLTVPILWAGNTHIGQDAIDAWNDVNTGGALDNLTIVGVSWNNSNAPLAGNNDDETIVPVAEWRVVTLRLQANAGYSFGNVTFAGTPEVVGTAPPSTPGALTVETEDGENTATRNLNEFIDLQIPLHFTQEPAIETAAAIPALTVLTRVAIPVGPAGVPLDSQTKAQIQAIMEPAFTTWGGVLYDATWTGGNGVPAGWVAGDRFTNEPGDVFNLTLTIKPLPGNALHNTITVAEVAAAAPAGNANAARTTVSDTTTGAMGYVGAYITVVFAYTVTP